MTHNDYRALDDQLATLGWSLETLEAVAESVILFGSRAAGVANARSDWDILCVGHGATTKSKSVDVVWVSPLKLQSSKWLGSELASHVARFGKTIRGKLEWRSAVRVEESAVSKKARRIERRLCCLSDVWQLLSVDFRKKHSILVHRDLCRLDCLYAHEPVPPTALLRADLNRLESLVQTRPEFQGSKALGTFQMMAKEFADEFNL